MPNGGDATASASMMYHNHNNRPKSAKEARQKKIYYYTTKYKRRVSFAKIQVKAMIDLGTNLALNNKTKQKKNGKK